MKTIVAATDFSHVSLNAVYYAADLFLVTGSELAIFHAFPIAVPFSEWSEPATRMEAFLSEAEAELDRLKQKIIFMMAERIMVSSKITVGEVSVQLKQYCESVNPYAVVMGSENTSALERVLFGAKTIAAMRYLSWPLVIVPPDVKFKDIRTIALASDFVNVSDTVPFSVIRALVKEFNASLHVLHVNNDDTETFNPDRLQESDLLQQLLAGVNPQFHYFHDTNMEKAIIDFSEANNVDVLIVIPKKHDVISSLFHHSFSKRLVLQAHFPVMAMHE
jgi:nucleotide-binding universal stress UspA family protein